MKLQIESVSKYRIEELVIYPRQWLEYGAFLDNKSNILSSQRSICIHRQRIPHLQEQCIIKLNLDVRDYGL